MSKTYFISQEGQQLGPLSLDEIIHQLKTHKLAPIDFIFDEAQGDWVLIMQFSALIEQLYSSKPEARPQSINTKENAEHRNTAPQETSNIMRSEWYILKGEQKYGPFPYPEVIKMLQEKIIFEFDFAWASGMEQWCRVAELEAFQAKYIEKLKKTLLPDIKDVFFRRKHPRVKYQGTVLVHDNKSVWRGQGFELSSGGAGIVMENAMVVPGQEVHLHFKPSNGLVPFNAICEVVSKRFKKEIRGRKAPVQYGLKFKKLNKDTKKILEDFTQKGTLVS